MVGGRYGASASEAAPSPPLIIGRSTNVGAAMPQPPPNPAKHPDQSRLAGLPPAGMQALQAALQAIRRGDAGEGLRLTGEVRGLVPEIGRDSRSEIVWEYVSNTGVAG